MVHTVLYLAYVSAALWIWNDLFRIGIILYSLIVTFDLVKRKGT
jgi:hypothetical protein